MLETLNLEQKAGASVSRVCVLCPDGEGLPLTQPQPTHGTLGGGSCPGTPEMRRRQEESMRRLASQVPDTRVTDKHTGDGLRLQVLRHADMIFFLLFFLLLFLPFAFFTNENDLFICCGYIQHQSKVWTRFLIELIEKMCPNF